MEASPGAAVLTQILTDLGSSTGSVGRSAAGLAVHSPVRGCDLIGACAIRHPSLSCPLASAGACRPPASSWKDDNEHSCTRYLRCPDRSGRRRGHPSDTHTAAVVNEAGRMLGH